MRIYCCACAGEVEARLTDGREIYPHRSDLKALPFWRCDACGNFVGCHHKTKNRTAPLGCIPTPELRAARKHLHALIDPVWQSGRMARKDLYASISREVGWNAPRQTRNTAYPCKSITTALVKPRRNNKAN